MYLKHEIGTPFGRGLAVQAIIGSRPLSPRTQIAQRQIVMLCYREMF